MKLLSEKARDILSKINKYLPDWAEFEVRQFGTIYQATIKIESYYFDTFKITTESSCLESALEQILKMLEMYWVYNESDNANINELVEDLKKEGIISQT